MRRTLVVGALALSLAAGCGEKKAEGPAATPEAAAAPAGPSFDAAGLKAKLQGTWVSGSDKKDYFKFVFEGDKVSVTDMRFAGEPKTQSGALELESPQEIGVKVSDGTTYKYALAEVNGKFHMGLGKVFEVKSLDEFELQTSTFESVSRKGGACKWVKVFGDKREEKDVTCAVADKDGQKVLTYQQPSSFEKDKLEDHTLFVFGTVLLDEEMLNSVAKKQ